MGPTPGKPGSPPEGVREERAERQILKFSVWGALFFALTGLVWGVLAGSQMIKFDGLYSFVSVILSSVSVFAARSLKRGDDERFPFGRAQMEPLAIAFKSTAITVLCLIAFAQALVSLFTGGREINAVFAMAYALVATSGCLGGYLYITRKRKQAPASDLARAEGMQWLMDTALSGAVLAGFLASFLLQQAGREDWARYLDPLMVIAASAFFIKSPILTLVGGIRELLLMAPGGETHRLSREALEEIARERGFAGVVLRISKNGREFDYKIGFLAADPARRRTLAELDEIRGEVLARLRTLCANPIWLGVSFIHDRKWA